MSTPAATSVENVREKRAIVIFRTTSPIFIGSFSLKRSQLRLPCSVLRHFLKPNVVPMPNAMIRYQSRLDEVRGVDDPLRQRRQLAAERQEDLGEERDEEEQHAGEDEGREDQDHRRVHHRALDAALQLRLALDLERHAVEHLVQDSCRLARLDHRDEQAREDLRVAVHRLAEQQTAFDVRAQLADDRRDRYLSSVCSSRMTSAATTLRPASIIVANWREKICSDFGLIFLNVGLHAVLAGGRQLLELLREQAADAQLLARGVERRRVDLTVGEEALAR